jgi:hypothetical protein
MSAPPFHQKIEAPLPVTTPKPNEEMLRRCVKERWQNRYPF